jgi:hypothetical protein
MRAPIVASVLILGSASCSRTFETTVVQPNPLVAPTETLRVSEEAIIVTGDMDLRVPRSPGPSRRAAPLRTTRYPLNNTATFTLVSRDRLRFHVQIEHKWKEWADLTSWTVVFEDDMGHRYQPEAVEHASTRHLVTMWDVEQRSVQRNLYGDIVAINEDGWARRQPLGSLSVFRGRADFVFYHRDIMSRRSRWLRLTVSRPGQAFQFTWNFTDSVVASAE